jgi:ubiquinone/menaquinone biosynthesis C-methylase UbiE
MSSKPDPAPPGYSARAAYQGEAAGANYMREGPGGPLTRYRREVERRAVRALTSDIPAGARILDCPTGNGRWLPALAARSPTVTGIDLSTGMLRHARERGAGCGIAGGFVCGEVERLPFAEDSFDFVFSFALTKHLPWPVQYRAMAEFGRVASQGVICSFSLLGPTGYAVWRRRRIAESYPVFREQLAAMAGEAGLRIVRTLRCATPVGVEHLVRFDTIRRR